MTCDWKLPQWFVIVSVNVPPPIQASMMMPLRTRALLTLVLAWGMVFGAAPVLAGSLASPWSKGFHSKVRLTAATLLGENDGTALYAGVDVRLDKNWKTYWRVPGDGGGIPPEFDWSGSRNVANARVMYPVPRRLSDKYGTSIGYKGGVLFPVALTPVNPALPINLRLKIYFGVCEEICIPAEAELSLDVAPGARATIPVQRNIMDALAKVPSETRDGMKISAHKARLSGDAPHLVVSVRVDDPSTAADLFVASRNGDYLPLAERIGRDADGTTTFRVDLKHLEPAVSLEGKTLDLTAVAGGRGIAQAWTVTPSP